MSLKRRGSFFTAYIVDRQWFEYVCVLYALAGDNFKSVLFSIAAWCILYKCSWWINITLHGIFLTMKLSFLLLLLTFVANSLYARNVHQTTTNKSPNYKHQNRINGTTKINISTSVIPVGRNFKQFPACDTTKKCRRSNSTTTNANKHRTSNTTQKYTKLNGTDTVTKKVVIADHQTTTESDLLHTRFFINPPEKKKESACMEGLALAANGECVLKFPDD
ncbi:uncharacterized protein LOC111031724 [Myzus persicae]|uniref:uncharacterized protein LOC111031724 n=1 Tax=Myzus persicae TaxID=13164 RepID=UPI000B936FC6|nr:uncharacterized protein LOC111031724 [Myzus persicae]